VGKTGNPFFLPACRADLVRGMNHAKREQVVNKVPAVLAETDAVVTRVHAATCTAPGIPQAE